ncbi:MAG: RCC1 repeat-containing protein, partial [Polyangiaceae bacterium]
MGLLGNPGDGGYTQGVLDIAMPGGKKATEIAAGTETTCALLEDGTVACWGYNTYGQAGVSTDSGVEVVTTPAVVGGVALAEQITMGTAGEHVCARIHGGSVKCWGANNFAQLGASTSEAGVVGAMSATPIDVQF